MLIDKLDESIRATITNWTKEIQGDLKSIISLIQIGGEQTGFTEWMIERVKNNGKIGWWKAMCLFRSYNLRGSDPGTDQSNQIRAEIRAATEAPCPFQQGTWNRGYNQKIFAEWIKSNKSFIQEALRKNAEIATLDNGRYNEQNDLFPEEVIFSSKENLFEGSVREIIVNAYERDPVARQRCIDYHGLNCSVCQFNFEEQYGVLGKGFIHVHHLKPLSEIGEKYEVNPIDDLRPVCPNCHGMVHKKKPPYSIEELQRIIKP